MWTKRSLSVDGEEFYYLLSLIHGRKHLADIRACKPCSYVRIWQGGVIAQSLTWLAVIKSECRSQCLYADTSLEWKSKPEAIPVVSGWCNCSHQLGMSCPPWQEKLSLMNWVPRARSINQGGNHQIIVVVLLTCCIPSLPYFLKR